MIASLLILITGLTVLVVGGEFLVRGAVRLAGRARVSPLLIGIVIVGFGTSMPELVTSVRAAMAGSAGIAWGNIVGSNLLNTLAILGLSALIAPFALSGRGLWRDSAVALAATVLLYGLALFGLVGRLAGAGLIALLIGYLLLAYFQERHRIENHGAAYDKGAAHEELEHFEADGGPAAWTAAIVMTLGGLGMLVIGGGMLVHGSVELARIAGISETVIGLTIVAFGTSAPELVTSVVAALRRHGELAFGNVVGSNLYNLLGIGGFTAVAAPGTLPEELLRLEFPLLLASAVALLLIAALRGYFGRIAGLILFGGYCAHLALLIAG